MPIYAIPHRNCVTFPKYDQTHYVWHQKLAFIQSWHTYIESLHYASRLGNDQGLHMAAQKCYVFTERHELEIQTQIHKLVVDLIETATKYGGTSPCQLG